MFRGRSFGRDTLFAEGMKNDGATDGEAANRGQSQGLGEIWAEAQVIGEERGQGAHDADHVQPERRMNRIGLVAITQTELQQHGGQSDGSDHHHRERAEECAPGGEDDNQGERSAEQARGNDGPATRLGSVGQGSFILEEESYAFCGTGARGRFPGVESG